MSDDITIKWVVPVANIPGEKEWPLFETFLGFGTWLSLNGKYDMEIDKRQGLYVIKA